MKESCEFDRHGCCHAWACYSNKECAARDERGGPIYVVNPKKCPDCPALKQEAKK